MSRLEPLYKMFLNRNACRMVCSVTLLSAGFCAHAATPVTPPASAPLAVVNGVPIQRTAVNTLITSSKADETPAIREQVKQALIDRELIRQAADASPVRADPAVQREIQSAVDDIKIQAYLDQVARSAPVTDQAVRARYDTLVHQMGPSDYRLRVILLANGDEARQVQQKLNAGGDFTALAQKYGLGPTAASGGVLPWLNLKAPVVAGNTRGLPLPVAQAVLGMEVGTRSLVQAGDRYYIIDLQEKRAAQLSSFDDSRGMVRQQLVEEARRKAISDEIVRLRKRANIQE